MSFMNDSTEVIRAPEPSVVIGHDNKELLSLCTKAEQKYNFFHNQSQNLMSTSKQCLSLWAESLGTRQSMGKLLLQHQNKYLKYFMKYYT